MRTKENHILENNNRGAAAPLEEAGRRRGELPSQAKEEEGAATAPRPSTTVGKGREGVEGQGETLTHPGSSTQQLLQASASAPAAAAVPPPPPAKEVGTTQAKDDDDTTTEARATAAPEKKPKKKKQHDDDTSSNNLMMTRTTTSVGIAVAVEPVSVGIPDDTANSLSCPGRPGAYSVEGPGVNRVGGENESTTNGSANGSLQSSNHACQQPSSSAAPPNDNNDCQQQVRGVVDDGLVEARRVEEGEGGGCPQDSGLLLQLPRATEATGHHAPKAAASSRREEETRKQNRILIGLFVVAAVLALFFILWGTGVIFNNTSSNSSTSGGGDNQQAGTESTTSSTTATTMTPSQYLERFLPQETIQELKSSSSESESSPQSMAFRWLQEDPNLKTYTPERILQRFALSTLFYATDGPRSWIQRNHWLSYEVHECSWHFNGRVKVFSKSYQAKSPCDTIEDPPHGNNNPFSIRRGRSNPWRNNSTTTTTPTTTTTTASTDPYPESYKLLWNWQNNLTGTIPKEIYWLTHLQSIDLAKNTITGTLPHNEMDLMKLHDLRHYSFFDNYITGSLPSQLCLLSNTLEFLYLGRNHMTGSIPTHLAKLSNSLSQMTIHVNDFGGTIPSQLGKLTKLSVLGLWNMPLLVGTIPTQFGLLSSLKYIYANGNPQLSGTIPTQMVGQLTNLAWLWLQNNNNLTGPIPSQLGFARKVKELRLENNNLSNMLPTQIGLLSTMYKFKASSNQLTSTIPTQYGLLTALQVLDLHNNDLAGQLPKESESLTSLKIFNVSLNDGLTGSIPSGLCHLNSSYLGFDCSPHILCGCYCPCSGSF